MNFDGVRTQIKRLSRGGGKGGCIVSFFCAIKWLFSGWGYNWGYKVGLHFSKSGVTKQGFGVVRWRGVKIPFFLR